MKISKIKKTAKGKYNLILDNQEKIVTYDEVILKNNLLFQKEVDDDLLSKLNSETKYYDVYNKVVKLISVRLRSEKEINDYLDKNKIDSKQKNQVISDLIKNGLINDKQFAKAFIMDKLNFSNFGPAKIKNELREHNIDDEIINNELSQVDNDVYIQKIEKIVNKKVNSNTKYSTYILKQKIISDLINLGFYRDDISSCLESVKSNNNNLIDLAYDKIYRKLVLKYEGDELYRKIKEKLYQKGFSFLEIDEIINKKIG